MERKKEPVKIADFISRYGAVIVAVARFMYDVLTHGDPLR